MYSGKEICQACKRPGTEISRWSKTDLCQECKGALDVGRARLHEDALEYTYVRQHVHGWPTLDFNDSILPTAMRGILRAMDNPAAATSGKLEAITGASGDNVMTVKIPTVYLEPLRAFSDSMSEYVRGIYEEKKGLPQMAREAVQAEKDRIFNQGIKKGRSLLAQLNTGDVTLEEFEKNYSYTQRNLVD